MRILRILILMVLLAGGSSASALSIDSTSIVGKILQRVKFSGYAMAGWEYHQNNEPENQFAVNKIILTANVKVIPKLNAQVMFDFKNFALQELWASYAFCPEINVKLGQFKTPFSIESPISPSILEMIPCVSLVTNRLICGDSPLMMRGGGGRDIGITLYGSFFGDRLSYDLAVMNGAGRNRRDDNKQKDFVARLGVKPLECLLLSGSAILGTGNVEMNLVDDKYICLEVPELTDVKRNGNFTRRRYAAGAQLKTRRFDARGEWMWAKDGNLNSDGCYVTAAVKDVATHGLDFLVSFDHYNSYRDSQNRYSAGVQYWFLKKCRIQLGYYYKKWCGYSGGESSVLTQLQLAF